MNSGRMAMAAGILAAAAWGQVTAPQIVAKSLHARGGAARFAAVRSFLFVGHLELDGGKQASLEVWSAAHPRRIRIEVSLPEGKLVQGWDGTEAWEIAPGKSQAQTLTGDEAKQVQDQALGFMDLLAMTDAKVALLGQGKLEGHDYYKLGVTISTGDTFVQYLDAHTWLAFHEEYPGGVEEISDYRKVNGLLLPFRYVSGPAGQPGTPLVRDRMTLDAPIDAAIFKMP
ncbi:MAG: hypothetical protein ACRD1L_10690 [Terriglobales bacterium]